MTLTSSTSRWAASPFDLAVFRIVVGVLVLVFTDVPYTVALARLPPALATAAPGLAFPLAGVPLDPTWVAVCGYGLKVACGLAVIGLFARPALVVATLLALYFLGVAQHAGAVVHHHHLVWFLALLAASPCDDVLSIRAAREAAGGALRPPRRSLAYGVPVWGARVLIGVIFFFPGVHKLAESGVDWVLSDNLRNQMYYKWFQHGAVPSWRIDEHPRLLRALAGAAVAFELTLLPLLFWRRARPVMAGAAVGFHLFTELFMYIRFVALWPCYVVLLDAHAAARGLAAEVFPRKLVVEGPRPLIDALRSADLFGRVIYRVRDDARVAWRELVWRHPLAPLAALGPRLPRTAAVRRASVAGAVALVLVLGNVVAGATATTQAWPFACFPTFQWLAPDTIPHLAIDAVRADGARLAIPTWPRSQKEWGVVWSVIGATHGPFEADRLRAYWSRAGRERALAAERGAVSVRLYRAHSSVVPERRGEPPLRRELLLELPP